MVVVVAEELKHNMEEQEVYTVEVLISMRNLGGFPNYGCKYCHMVHYLVDRCKRVDSPMEGFYSLSWIYMGFSPLDTDYDALHMGVPFDYNSSLLEHALLQQEQGKHKTIEKQSYFFFFFFKQ